MEKNRQISSKIVRHILPEYDSVLLLLFIKKENEYMNDAVEAIRLETEIGVYIIKGSAELLKAMTHFIVWVVNDRIENGHVFPGQKSARTIALMSKPSQPTMISLLDNKTGKPPFMPKTGTPIVYDTAQRERLAYMLKKAGVHFRFVPNYTDDGTIRIMCPPDDSSKAQAILEQFNQEEIKQLESDLDNIEERIKNGLAATQTEKTQLNDAKNEIEDIKQGKENITVKKTDGIEKEYAESLTKDAGDRMIAEENGISEPIKKGLALDVLTRDYSESLCHSDEDKYAYIYFPEEKIHFVRRFYNTDDNEVGNMYSVYTFTDQNGRMTNLSDAGYTKDTWKTEGLPKLLKMAGVKESSKCLFFDTQAEAERYMNRREKVVREEHKKRRQSAIEAAKEDGPSIDNIINEVENINQEEEKEILANQNDPNEWVELEFDKNTMAFFYDSPAKSHIKLRDYPQGYTFTFDLSKAQFIKKSEGVFTVKIKRDTAATLTAFNGVEKEVSVQSAVNRIKDMLGTAKEIARKKTEEEIEEAFRHY